MHSLDGHGVRAPNGRSGARRVKGHRETDAPAAVPSRRDCAGDDGCRRRCCRPPRCDADPSTRCADSGDGSCQRCRGRPARRHGMDYTCLAAPYPSTARRLECSVRGMTSSERGVDIDALLAQVRERIRETREEGIYAPDVEALLRVPRPRRRPICLDVWHAPLAWLAEALAAEA